MENHHPHELIDSWKKGISLSKALSEFADAEVSKSNQQLMQEHRDKPISSVPPKDKQLHPLERSLSGAMFLLNSNSIKKDAEDNLKQNILNKIIDLELLIGLGLEVPFDSSSIPQLIPIQIWPNKISDINWEESSFYSNEIEFKNIRLIETVNFFNYSKNKKSGNKYQKNVAELNQEVKEKKTGRPTLKNKIMEGYEYLKNENAIDFNKTFQAHINLIHETIITLNPELRDVKGLHEKTIKRHLSARFSEEKKDSKKT